MRNMGGKSQDADHGRDRMMRHLSYAAALLMLICGEESAHDSKIKGVNKDTDITIKRGVVNGDTFNQWESQHPRRFEVPPPRKP